MPVVLCFGDSNTWGANPATQGRFPRNAAWPGVMRARLGSDYLVIDEGLPGRTTVWDDPIEGHKNGKKHLPPLLQSHKPLDLVTILLGTNDLKQRFSVSAYDIAEGAKALIDIVQKSDAGPDDAPPQVLLMAPPPLAQLSTYRDMFAGGPEKSQRFAQEYSRVAQEMGCHFFDAGQVIVSSAVDGIHFDKEEHGKLGEAMAERVRSLLS